MAESWRAYIRDFAVLVETEVYTVKLAPIKRTLAGPFQVSA